jgi:ketosteroid isomerase-like protein
VLTAEDNRVAMEAVSYGERSNGRIYKNFYHFQHEIRDGKLVAVREYLDTDHAYRILLAE